MPGPPRMLGGIPDRANSPTVGGSAQKAPRMVAAAWTLAIQCALALTGQPARLSSGPSEPVYAASRTASSDSSPAPSAPPTIASDATNHASTA